MVGRVEDAHAAVAEFGKDRVRLRVAPGVRHGRGE